MPDEQPSIQVELTPAFQRQLRKLAKRYRSIRKDVESVTHQLAAGNLLGDQLAGIGYAIYKVRIKNSDIQKGKSAGYRLIYYLETASLIILLTIYSKSDRSDITVREIEDILAER